MTDSSYKLQYFDLGVLAEAIRMTFHAKGVPFTDERITFVSGQFYVIKPTLPNGSLPVLYVDNNPVPMNQSDAILRYLGDTFDMFPTDPMEKYLCNEIIETCGDILKGLMVIFQICFLPKKLGHGEKSKEEL